MVNKTDYSKHDELDYKLFWHLILMDRFDLNLIQEFDFSSTGLSVVLWMKKAELIYQLCKLKEPATVIPLRLLKCTYVVYQQLNEEEEYNFTKIKWALYIALGTDPFVACQQFSGLQLFPSEMVDVYLADLQNFGGA